jgi:NAD(P)-dependent dehydrogenase (short-subunit alcohol dehydrogenase family)
MLFSNALIALTGVGREGQVGEVVARALAARGARLALLDVNADAVRARAAAIVASGGDARAYPCDLTDADAVRRVADEIVASTSGGGGVRALVNVAGGFAASGPVGESDVAVLQRQIAINLTTAYCATRAFLPALRAAAATNSGGGGGGGGGDASVVYFAAAAALPGARIAGLSAYVAAKSGVLALMRAVAEEERDRGVRANAIAPTAIRTGDNLRAMGDAAGVRYVERESVADAVVYLCSPAARNVTGQVLKLE